MTNNPLRRAGLLRPTMHSAAMLIAIGSFLVVQAVEAQYRTLDEPEIAELNEKLGQPDLLFGNKPVAHINGQSVRLLAIDDDGVFVLTADGRQRKLRDSAIRTFIIGDQKFTYDAPNETPLELITRIKAIPRLRQRYGLIANNPAIDGLLGATTMSIPTVGAAEEEAVVSVPMPAYEVDRPWEQVALLNPPPPPRRPRPAPPTTPPPAIAPPAQPSGIPEWGKYAIAATGVMAIIVFLKR